MEGDTSDIRRPDSEGDTSGAFYISLDGSVQYALETTTLIMSDKFKEESTAEMLHIHYKY